MTSYTKFFLSRRCPAPRCWTPRPTTTTGSRWWRPRPTSPPPPTSPPTSTSQEQSPRPAPVWGKFGSSKVFKQIKIFCTLTKIFFYQWPLFWTPSKFSFKYDDFSENMTLVNDSVNAPWVPSSSLNCNLLLTFFWLWALHENACAHI